MNIEIYSRDAMEQKLLSGLPEHTAVISFYDPPRCWGHGNLPPVDYGSHPRVFQVAVYDIDPEALPEFGLCFETYFPEAEALAAFIKDAACKGLHILCQCEYGQSRSAACAAAIREYFTRDGIKIFADYRYYPNQMIFNKLLSALEST